MGDLIVTATSKHSRNKRAGILLGKGIKREEVGNKIGMIVEGIPTTKACYDLAKNISLIFLLQVNYIAFYMKVNQLKVH